MLVGEQQRKEVSKYERQMRKTFLMTYRMFISPIDLLDELVERSYQKSFSLSLSLCPLALFLFLVSSFS
jgi:hypothetical protein